MKRQLFTSILCVVLLLVMLMATTLAWFTDREYNVNTMVAGKISIEQKEYSDAAHTVEFVNNEFVMMPSQTVVKEVVVTNTGNQPCYVRTLFAFEDSADVKVLEMLSTTGATITFPTDASDNKIQFTVTKDGKTTLFTVGCYVHPGKLSHENGEDEITVLKSITLSAAAENAWHEAVGDYYELFVLSQATQTAGLDNLGENGTESPSAALDKAFKPISAADCATWFAAVLNGTDAYTPNGVEATVVGNAITIAAVQEP